MPKNYFQSSASKLRQGYRKIIGILLLLSPLTCKAFSLTLMPGEMSGVRIGQFGARNLPTASVFNSAEAEIIVSWYRFLLSQGLYEGIPGEPTVIRRISPPISSEKPKTAFPAVRTMGRSKGSKKAIKVNKRGAIKKKQTEGEINIPPVGNSGRVVKKSRNKSSNFSHQKTKIIKKMGLMTKEQKTQAMQKLKVEVEAAGGSWDRLKNYHAELTKDEQFLMAETLIHLGNKLEKINRKPIHPVALNAEEIILDFNEINDHFTPHLAHYLVDAFARRIIELKNEPLQQRWQPLVRFLIPFVMIEYGWDYVLYESWHALLREQYLAMMPDIHLHTGLYNFPEHYRTLFDHHAHLDAKNIFRSPRAQYSFLPHPLGSRILWRYAEGIRAEDDNPISPAQFIKDFDESDLLLIPAFQITVSYWLNTVSGPLDNTQRLFVILWLCLRDKEAGSFFRWSDYVYDPLDEQNPQLQDESDNGLFELPDDSSDEGTNEETRSDGQEIPEQEPH